MIFPPKVTYILGSITTMITLFHCPVCQISIIDFAIITVLDSEANVNSATFQVVLCQTEVPCSHLEDMKQVAWHVIIFNTIVHYFTQRFHLKIT